jgi:hypothetical protein
MDETKEWIYLLLLTVYYLTPEILLEFLVLFSCLLTYLCVLLTNLIFWFCVQFHIQFSKFFRSIAYQFFGFALRSFTRSGAHHSKPTSFVSHMRSFGGQSRSDGEAKYTYRCLCVNPVRSLSVSNRDV